MKLVVTKSGRYFYFETLSGKYIGKTDNPKEAEKIIKKYSAFQRMEHL